MIRYKTTPEMTLVRLKDNKEIHLQEIKLGNFNGGTNTVLKVEIDGQATNIARSVIDEKAFSLGPTAVYKNKKKKKAERMPPITVGGVNKTTPTPDAGPGTSVVVRPEQFVSISKEELVNIHRALQAAADATQRLLVRLVMQGS